ncbi:MAG: HEAT repeat domain-containing protein [Myxococcales bacterium]|nr:HEAT repeat domain-containing protein [Myxococcales bacterium]
MTRILCLMLALGLPLAASAQVAPDNEPAGPALTPPPVVRPTDARETLRRWFQGFEFVPEEAHFRRLGDGLAPGLLALANDEAQPLTIRARAVSSMIYADDAATGAWLVARLSDPDAPSLLRRKAALAVGERQGAAAIDLLASALINASDDVPLREACARALRGLGPVAYAARDALLKSETAPTVRGLLLDDKRIGMPR